MPKFILYGGKGGVGKTTCAAATALDLSREGHKTLVVSTDPAHSIGDVFEQPVSEKPTQVAESPVYAVEVDPKERFKERYEDTFDSVIGRAQDFGVDVDRDDVSDVASEGMVPGSDEVAVVDLFVQYSESDEWDVVVFDTAPTGHTLRLLNLPDVMSTTMGKVLAMRSQVSNLTSKVSSVFSDDDEEDDNLDINEAQNMMDEVGEILRDDEMTEFRVVTAPEEMALQETERLIAQLNEFDVKVGGVIANKVLLDGGDDCEFCRSRRTRQQALLTDAENRFNRPITQIPLLTDPTGQDHLETVANHIDTPDIRVENTGEGEEFRKLL